MSEYSVSRGVNDNTVVVLQATGSNGRPPLFQPFVIVIFPPGLDLSAMDDEAVVEEARGQLRLVTE